jgi:hypothetical protein
MCGAVLVGAKGIHKISKSYIEIAGFVRDWKADPETGWREYTYISAPDKRQMAFCTEDDAPCLFDYVEMKRNSNRVRREQRLRDEAATDWEIRNTGSTGERRGSPPPATPPSY